MSSLHPTSLKMRTFVLVWFGQMISLIGSQTTDFALGIWVYEQTGSITQFTLIWLFAILPNILISPLAGALVDRWDRRWTMILSDAGSALTKLIMIVLLLSGHLQIWQIYGIVTFSGLCNAFQVPAYSAAIPSLVPPSQFVRASGLLQLAQASALLLSPLIGGVLLDTLHLLGVLLLDLLTFGWAVLTLLLVRFPSTSTPPTKTTQTTSLLAEIAEGWHYITTRPGLQGLLIFNAASSFFQGMVNILFRPLVLSISSASTLGIVSLIGGIGMILGGVLLTVKKGTGQLVLTILVFEGLSGCWIVLGGLRSSSLFFLTLALFFYLFGIPFIQGSSKVIWQRKIPIHLQGRVFALRQVISSAGFPLALLIGGPLADYLFEPLMATDGWLAGSLGQIVGIGRGKGIALMYVILGSAIVLTTALAYQYPRLRYLEKELPDEIKE